MLVQPLVGYLPAASSAGPSLPVRSKQCDCDILLPHKKLELQRGNFLDELTQAITYLRCSSCHRSE